MAESKASGQALGVPGTRRLGLRVSVLFLVLTSLVGLTTLLLGGASLLAFRAESGERRALLARDLEASADQLAARLSLPIWNFDRPQVAQILDSFMGQPNVREVAVRSGSGLEESTARFRGPDWSPLTADHVPLPWGAAPPADIVVSERLITHSGETIGAVRLAFTTRFLDAELRSLLRSRLWSVVLLDLLLIASLSFLLWGLVLRPLNEIQRFAGMVSTGALEKVPQPKGRYFGELASLQESLVQTFGLLQERYAKLQLSEERVRVLIESTTDFIWSVDRNHGLLTFNTTFADHFRQAFGTHAQIGASPEELLPPERAHPWHALYDRAIASGSFRVEYPLQAGRILELVCNPILSGGEAVGVSVFGKDITYQKLAEEEKARLQAQLQQSQKMESLGVLAGGVAHDMNNVLGAILGLASAHLEIQPEGTPVHQAFNTIFKAASRGGSLVKSLLTFARQTPAEERELDLNAILREEVTLLERTTLSKINLEMDLEPSLGRIRGDESALTHAFMNLCVNAVDAMPDSGTLALRTRNVDSGWVEVRVEDSGTGMPKEVLEKAMDPFFTTKGAGKGTGLGLSMVFSTVKAHRGRMEIQSEVGRGTCVRMVFPVLGTTDPASIPVGRQGAEPSQRSLDVLLVDDDELILDSTEVLLEQLGHRATAVSSGEAALAKVEGGLQPDVVLLDLNMPGLGGAQTLAHLRAIRSGLPILLVTGRIDEAARSLVEAHSNVTLLSKPFSLKELQQSLEPFGREGQPLAQPK